MKITERQARIRLAAAVAAAGGQTAYAKRLTGLPLAALQTAVSRSVLGRRPVHELILADLGLRRDEQGEIHAPDRPKPNAVPFVDIDRVTDADGVTRRLSSSVRVF